MRPVIAELSPCASLVIMMDGNWCQTFPAGELPGKLRFYRGLRDRAGGRFAKHYAPAVAALETVEAELAHVAR